MDLSAFGSDSSVFHRSFYLHQPELAAFPLINGPGNERQSYKESTEA
ncbi:MAG: hypothetical protein IPI10_14685 [Bacteroidetes bacterium]|nr:hypothetical protein [Bacteroidota bacterium]